MALAREHPEEFFGLAIDAEGLDSYLAARSITFPVLVIANADFPKGLEGTPSTVVVNASGKVQQLWAGAYTGQRKQQIEQYFKIALPVDTAKPGLGADFDAGDHGVIAPGDPEKFSHSGMK